MTSSPLWISEADVKALLDPAALIAAIEAGFRAAAAGAIREPSSTRIDGLDGAGAYMTLYPAHAEGGLASAKILAGRPANAAEGRPEIDAMTALVDPRDGRIAALISACALTAYRTAAGTAAVLKRLLRKEPVRVGLLGTGAQIGAHGRMLAAAGLVADFAIASPRGDMAKAKAAAQSIAAATGIDARPCAPRDIAHGRDALILATLADRPANLGAIGATCLIASIGPFYPHAQELDPAIVAQAAFVVSDHPDRLRRQWAGSPLLDAEALRLFSAADLLSGNVAPPPAGRSIFLSDGRAFQDNVAAATIYHAALAAGRGTRLP
jgi:ornithine cyclodeaminase/alanine dehydrogenase-like protein (mu-crystallin family)